VIEKEAVAFDVLQAHLERQRESVSRIRRS
jgi:hypothetical protein